MIDFASYEIVVGLEVHARLLTASKLFCADSNQYGAAPNTNVSPITLGHPGTLPKLNKKAVELAVKMGLACQCQINKENYFARKNYFYPDLPKGYQISQQTVPICSNGFVPITVEDKQKNIRLHRIHLEEDAGKSLHDVDEKYSCIDYNRAGTPLIEIVTEPDIRSSEEAYAFVNEIRKLVRYLDVCDGNMEEGSLRCDVNISVRPKGSHLLGTRVEIKNLNSVRHVKKAIETEAERLIHKIEAGHSIIQETRSFDVQIGTTHPIREKENEDDYRYFPDPDLPPLHLQESFIKNIRNEMPVLPQERIKKYMIDWQLSDYDATLITEEKAFADYFEQVILHTKNYKAAANWMLGPVKSWLNEQKKDIDALPILPEKLASVIQLIDEGKVNFSIASTAIFPQLLQNPSLSAAEIAQKQDLLQDSDMSSIEPVIDEILNTFADKVSAYQKGKKGLLAFFVGQVMKKTNGKADPQLTNTILLEKLNHYTKK